MLIVMGSGETAPTMVKPHREIFARVGAGPAVIMDTPYGFQENADDISARAVNYFAASVGRDVTVASWRTADGPPAAHERALAAIRDARWLFAGPGSPTYALRQWRDTPIPQLIVDRLRTEGAVVFASAAALTLGQYAIPVYEIYKAGFAAEWALGLDIFREATGLPAVIIPHYDNAEGGHHDTRFCYLGERRLAMMESRLPDETFIVGVDEHTAVVFDLDARTASVLGNGVMTIRRRGRETTHPSGAVATFDQLSQSSGVERVAPSFAEVEAGERDSGSSVTAVAQLVIARFDAAYANTDVEACVNAVLDLEQALADWAADTEEADDRDKIRGQLRTMVVRLGDLAAADRPGAANPLIDLIVTERSRSRAAGDYQTSDRLRAALAALSIEVRDTPSGPVWERLG
jgi:cyanophycinase-like exopeptidase